MNLNTLSAFCKSWGDLSSPFRVGDFVYATDGYVAVRVSGAALEGDLPESGNSIITGAAEKLDDLPSDSVGYGTPLPIHGHDFEQEERQCENCEGEGVLYDCLECGGSGEIEFDSGYADYADTCKSCDGHGQIVRSQWERTFPRRGVELTTVTECDDCDGSGKVSSNPDIYINGVCFQGQFLKRFMGFEGATIEVYSACVGMEQVHKPALVKWDEGEGLIMPVARHRLGE